MANNGEESGSGGKQPDPCLPTRLKPEQDAAQHKRGYDSGESILKKLELAFLFGTLLAAIGAAVFTKKQWETASDHEWRSLRAYVGIIDPFISGFRSDRALVHIPLKNFGTTPASNVFVVTWHRVNGGADTKNIHDFGIIDPSSANEAVIDIADIISNNRNSFLLGKNSLHVKLVICYSDSFKNNYRRDVGIFLNNRASDLAQDGKVGMHIEPSTSREEEDSRCREDNGN